MTTHTGLTVTAEVPVDPSDPRVADLERIRTATGAPGTTYVVVGLDNRAGEHDVVAAHLTVETAQGDTVTVLPVTARGQPAGLLAALRREGGDRRALGRLREEFLGDERVPMGRRSEAVYASREPLAVKEISSVALPIEERGPEYALFKRE